MEVYVTPELEAKLAHSAAQQGRNTNELVQVALTRYFEQEARFLDAVKLGTDQLQKGEYLTHEQVGKRLQRY
jgi:predicted transcriptional regulator